MRLRDITHCSQPPEQFTSFVMWMHRRTGSTWTTALLNSHPEITMLGEVFNVLDTPADFQEMCNFFSTPLGEHSPRGFGKTMTRVRGFKQKFFMCSYQDLHPLMCKAPDGVNALDRCLAPNPTPEERMLSSSGDLDMLSTLTQLSHDVFEQVNAKIICSLRYDSFRIALSETTQTILIHECGGSNLNNAEAEQCWARVRRAGVRVDPDKLESMMVDAQLHMQFFREVCEAEARLGRPVFFLYYEDLVDSPETTLADLQRFLGVSPMPLESHVAKANVDPDEWIVNWNEIAHLERHGFRTPPARSNKLCEMRDEYLTSTSQGGDSTQLGTNNEGDDDGSSYTVMPQTLCPPLLPPVEPPLPSAVPPPAGPNPLPAPSPAPTPLSSPGQMSQVNSSAISVAHGMPNVGFESPPLSFEAPAVNASGILNVFEEPGPVLTNGPIVGGALALLGLFLFLLTAPAFARACQPRAAERTQSLFTPTRRGRQRLRMTAVNEADAESSSNAAHAEEAQIQL